MPRKLFIVALLLLPAALLINLGLMVFIDDEGIRSLVTQEMLWTGNYLAPTLHGDAYLNKPPLFNWLLAVSFVLHGEASEWAARLPTVISLLGFAATAYYFSRRHFSDYYAGVHALMVITCGRMLFWDSMLALIDVTFSWVVYTQIMLLYAYGRRGEWWKAFGWSYALTAVGFMLKGLPAIIFQGVTIFALLTWVRGWKQFVRLPHLLTGALSVAMLGAYYWLYSAYVPLGMVFQRLFVESGKRTAAAHGWWENVGHFVAFPFEMSYHFLPWTVLSVCFFGVGRWKALKANDFAAFCLVAFLANLPVYWVSPNVYPRYLLMLFPLLFAAHLQSYSLHLRARTKIYHGLRYLFLGAALMATIVIPFIPLVPETAVVSFPWVKSIFFCGSAGAVFWMMRSEHRGLLLKLCVFLLLLRVIFNCFILPPRAAGDVRGIALRETAVSSMGSLRESQVAVYGYSLMEPATSFYLSRARGGVIRRQFERFDGETLYIVSPWQYPRAGPVAADSVYLRHQHRYYPIGRLPTPPRARVEDPEELLDGMGTGLW